MPKKDVTITEILKSVQESIQTKNIDFQTWENYFHFYCQMENTIGFGSENLIKLNKILLSAGVTFKTEEDEIWFKSEVRFLEKDLPRLQQILAYVYNAFDDRGYLKPEWAMTKKERNNLLDNSDFEIFEKDFENDIDLTDNNSVKR